MAGGMDLGTSSKGGKKSLDAALNLVPFIDVMAVTIIFLIMSAVWTQLGRLQVSQSGQSAPEDNTPPPVSQPVVLLLTEKEMKLSVGGLPMETISIVTNEKGTLDVINLVAKLAQLNAAEPERNSLTLQTEDAVKYDILVQVIDTCVGHKFPGVSVSPATN
jgi:biopolymer transport protein TolR